MRALYFLALSIAAVSATPRNTERIVGGIVTPIDRYPFMAGLLYSRDSSIFEFLCGGSIINTRSILSAAHCFFEDPVNRLRIRVGSNLINSGGVIYSVESTIGHALHGRPTLDNDIGIVRTAVPIVYIPNAVQPASIAGPNYNLPDNEVVWAAGWGNTEFLGESSEELRHVQVWTINREICAQRYQELNYGVTANMLCSGWLDMGGRGQCNGDSDGPLVHNGVVVGTTAWGHQCAPSRYPSVSMSVSRYTDWIRTHAS